MRSLVSIAALLLTSAAVPAASAQLLSVYGTYAPTHLTNVDTGVLTTGTTFQVEYTNYYSTSFGGGVTLRLLSLGPVNVGFDVRGTTHPGNNGADLVMGGIKLGGKLPILSLKPYIQASGGYLGTRTTNLSNTGGGGTFSNKYLAYEFLGGIDFPIVRILDFRLIEIGGGQGIQAFGGNTSQNATIFTIATGAVLHF